MPVTRFLLILLVLLNLLALAVGQGWLGESVPRGEPERLTNQINPQAISIRQADTPPSIPTVSDTASIVPNTGQSVPSENVATATTEVNPQPPVPMATPPVALEPTVNAEASSVTTETDTATQTAAPTTDAADATAMTERACIAYDGLGEQQAITLGRTAAAVNESVEVNRRMTETASNWWVHIPAPASRTLAEERATALRAAGIDLFIVRDEGPHKNAISLGIFRTERSARQHLADLKARRVTDAKIIARKPATFALELRGTQANLDEVAVRLRDNPYGVSARACVR